MKYAKKIDRNQPSIVQRLRDLGASVEPRLAAVGKGVPDLLVGVDGRNYLVEIKDGDKPPSARKLTRDEADWHDRWRGDVVVIESEQQAAEWLASIREAGL